MKGLAWRFAAIIWILTGGAILAAVIILTGAIYGMVNILARVLGQDSVLPPNLNLSVYVFYTDAITWWADQLYYAITSSGTGFDPIPPLPGVD